nr:uncharacterized protein LOC100181790 isoform X1 [Ciona intestinalis]|eukprot:XP_009860374.1 uncharacterized protein LOC100181790 isoform X1 [Ciona intestinalis]
MSRKPIGLILCGLGRMGLIHLDNVIHNPNVELLYVVESNLSHANQVLTKNNLNNVTVVHCDEIEKAFTDPLVEGVIICTPTDKHEPYLKLALKTGKHILCEKPIAIGLDTVMSCYREAKDKGLVLLCAFNRRFDPQLYKMREQRHTVGPIHSVKICSRDSPRPSIDYLKISGGIFHDCLIHDLDMLRWILEEDPVTVYTTAHTFDPEIKALDDYDTVFVVLKFPCGVIAHIDASRHCVFGYDQTVQIYGEKGNIISDNPLKSGLIRNGGAERDEIFYSFPTRYAAAYQEELKHFVDLIKGTTSVSRVKPSDTLRATYLCEAVEESCRTGKVINVPSFFQNLFKGKTDDPLLNE